MTKTQVYWIMGGLGALLLIMPSMAHAAYYTVTDWLIPSFEGFRPTPYWDNEQYSWGYGTRAPGPSGTITKEQALKDMRAYVDKDYAYLKPLVTRALAPNQWAALLSFSYNLGRYDADNLISNINSGDDQALEMQWKKYIYSAGVVSPDLIDRRAAEWDMWAGN